MRRALVVVDTQPTFCEDGGLPVVGGHDVAARIGAYVATSVDAGRYAEIVASQDWHVDPGEHWAPPGATPDFATSWPRHGAAGEPEADLHPALVRALGGAPGEVPEAITALVRKGMRAAAFSAFDGVVVDDPSAVEDPAGPPLAVWLRDRQIDAVDVCGIATDHCVRATVLDALAAGFPARLLEDLTVGVAPETTTQAVARMRAAGAEVAASTDVTTSP